MQNICFDKQNARNACESLIARQLIVRSEINANCREFVVFRRIITGRYTERHAPLPAGPTLAARMTNKVTVCKHQRVVRGRETTRYAQVNSTYEICKQSSNILFFTLEIILEQTTTVFVFFVLLFRFNIMINFARSSMRLGIYVKYIYNFLEPPKRENNVIIIYVESCVILQKERSIYKKKKN